MYSLCFDIILYVIFTVCTCVCVGNVLWYYPVVRINLCKKGRSFPLLLVFNFPGSYLLVLVRKHYVTFEKHKELSVTFMLQTSLYSELATDVARAQRILFDPLLYTNIATLYSICKMSQAKLYVFHVLVCYLASV